MTTKIIVEQAGPIASVVPAGFDREYVQELENQLLSVSPQPEAGWSVHYDPDITWGGHEGSPFPFEAWSGLSIEAVAGNIPPELVGIQSKKSGDVELSININTLDDGTMEVERAIYYLDDPIETETVAVVNGDVRLEAQLWFDMARAFVDEPEF